LKPDSIPIGDSFGSGGRALAGSVREALDKLANEFHFDWSIQNGTFQALDNRTVFAGRVVEISANGGTLISAVPLLVSAMQLQRGVEVKALMIPDLMPGDQMHLTSIVDSSLNNIYKMHEIEYAGSPNEREWLMTVRSFTYDMV
jgi:hypothetical protein